MPFASITKYARPPSALYSATRLGETYGCVALPPIDACSQEVAIGTNFWAVEIKSELAVAARVDPDTEQLIPMTPTWVVPFVPATKM
jgi:hypothetical protein